MSYKIEKAGYKFKGYELGQKVMYQGRKTTIIGFDERDGVIFPIVVANNYGNKDIRLGRGITTVLDVAHENNQRYEWASINEIAPIKEKEKPMEKKMTKADLEGKWVKVVKGDGRHFHTDDLIQIKDGGIRALDGGDTLRYWCDNLDESFSEKELRNKLLNSYAGLSIEYLDDYPQPQNKVKTDEVKQNEKSKVSEIKVKVDLLFDKPVIEETKEEVYIFSGRTTVYFNKELGIYGISTCNSKELPSYNKEIGMSLAYRRAYLSLNNK